MDGDSSGLSVNGIACHGTTPGARTGSSFLVLVVCLLVHRRIELSGERSGFGYTIGRAWNAKKHWVMDPLENPLPSEYCVSNTVVKAVVSGMVEPGISKDDI